MPKSATVCSYEHVIPTCALNQRDLYAQAYAKLSEPSPERRGLFPDKPTDSLETETTTRHDLVNQRSPSRALIDQI